MRVVECDVLGVSVGQKLTYRASTIGTVSFASGTGPFFTLYGSASKTVRVHRIFFTGTIATAAANAIINLTKRSAVQTGGTASAMTTVPIDSTSAAGTATVQAYTAAPTAGASVGTLETRRCLLNVTGAVATSDTLFDFRSQGGETQPIILRGTAEGVDLSFQTAPGNAVAGTVWAEWTEE